MTDKPSKPLKKFEFAYNLHEIKIRTGKVPWEKDNKINEWIKKSPYPVDYHVLPIHKEVIQND